MKNPYWWKKKISWESCIYSYGICVWIFFFIFIFFLETEETNVKQWRANPYTIKETVYDCSLLCERGSHHWCYCARFSGTRSKEYEWVLYTLCYLFFMFHSEQNRFSVFLPIKVLNWKISVPKLKVILVC